MDARDVSEFGLMLSPGAYYELPVRVNSNNAAYASISESVSVGCKSPASRSLGWPSRPLSM